MGDIAVGGTKRIKVTDGQGNELTPVQFEAVTDDDTIAVAGELGDQTARTLSGVAEGSGVLSVTGAGDHVGQSGSLDFTVDPSPLTVELVDL